MSTGRFNVAVVFVTESLSRPSATTNWAMIQTWLPGRFTRSMIKDSELSAIQSQYAIVQLIQLGMIRVYHCCRIQVVRNVCVTDMVVSVHNATTMACVRVELASLELNVTRVYRVTGVCHSNLAKVFSYRVYDNIKNIKQLLKTNLYVNFALSQRYDDV